MVASIRLLAAACVAALAACSSLTPQSDTGVARTGLVMDFAAREPKPDAPADQPAGEVPPAPTETSSFAPADQPAPAGAIRLVSERAAAEGGSRTASYRLNFENADLRVVIQAILGEALRINYVMTDDVSGAVTISSPRPMTAEELLSALDTLLQSHGFVMTKSGATMRIGPSAAGGQVEAAGRTTPGYGISVVPLRHVSADTMARLVSGFVVDADGVKVDASRNAMVVRGSGGKRQEAVQAIMSFDADWMEDQSVGIYEVKRAAPDAVVTELKRVFDAESAGAGAGLVQFKTIGRLRAVMVVAKTPALMRKAEMWVRRLDRETASGGENVFVYKARYRDAKDLARIITSLFRAGGDASGGPSSTGRRQQAPTGSGDEGELLSDNRSSSSPAAPAAVSTVATPGGPAPASKAGQGSSQGSSTAFNSPFFGDGTAQEANDEQIDLTRQEEGERPTILVSADAANNSVVTYADGHTYQKVLAALRQLDSTPLQVAIHATIAEVTLTDELKNGVEYFVKSGSLGLGRNNGSISLFGTAANLLSNSAPGFNLLIGSNASPDVVISALDRVTNVDVLSSPSLVVAENQPAHFQVGDEIPIVTRQAQSVDAVDAPLVNQVNFKNTGIILNVTPRIGQNDAVTMQIDQEISAVTSGANTLTPTISKRRVASTISVVSGQTVVLAGLISKRDERGKNGIPILGELKGIGDLFSQRSRTKGRSELVVLIRPIVIRSGEDARTVAEEFRSKLTALGSGRPASQTK